jgi:hypothetical protein
MKEEKTMKAYRVLLLAALLLVPAASFAANPGTANTNVYSANLVVSATVEDAVLLSLSTGTLAGMNGHCGIAGTNPNYTMSFGTVDALGVSAGCGNVFAPQTPGQTPAVYYTDYQLTPAWAGLTATSAATLTAYAAAPETGVNVQIPNTTDQSTTTGLNVGTWSTLGATAGTATPVVSGTVLSGAGADGTALTRFLALSIAPTATAAASGGTNVSTTVTFTMTIK